MSVFTSLHKDPLRPGLKIKELLKSDLKNNSDEFPLFIKLNSTPDSVVSNKIISSTQDSKTIYICKTFERLTFLKFKQLIDGEKYNVYSRYEQSFSQELRWQKNEDKPMEEEIALAMKNHLHLHFGPNVKEMPTEVQGIDRNTVQEWDAAFKVDDVLYLCEAKHVMCIDKIPKIAERLKEFKEKFQPHAHKDLSIGINKIVGVTCGTYFPVLVREEAKKAGLTRVSWRYEVDEKLPPGFEIEI